MLLGATIASCRLDQSIAHGDGREVRASYQFWATVPVFLQKNLPAPKAMWRCCRVRAIINSRVQAWSARIDERRAHEFVLLRCVSSTSVEAPMHTLASIPFSEENQQCDLFATMPRLAVVVLLPLVCDGEDLMHLAVLDPVVFTWLAFQHPGRVGPRLCHDIYIAMHRSGVCVQRLTWDALILLTSSYVCDHCMAHSSSLLNCQRCHLLRYCDRQCQAAAYREHKYGCRDIGAAQPCERPWIRGTPWMETLMARRKSAKLDLCEFMSRQPPVPVHAFHLYLRSALEHDADVEWLIAGN